LAHDRSAKIFRQLQKQFSSLNETNPERLEVISFEDVRLAHDLDFLSRLLDPQFVDAEIKHCYEIKELNSNPSKQLSQMPQDVLVQCRGTYEAIKKALTHDCAFFLGGGMHHAMSFAGRGFCLLNDVVIAARKAQQDLAVRKVLVLDVDAHKGDGTAQICYGDDSIFTMSLHMKNGWPLDGSLGSGPWELPSNLDIEFGSNEESEYLERLDAGLNEVLKESFDLAIIVLGADAWEQDELPSAHAIRLTTEQMLARDQLIESKLSKEKISRAYVMGGGYGQNAHIPYVNFLATLLD
tara:strand:+ start:7000 stop:7884 length:885 start_codon:yes stop_codon:yes gene_type:complete